MDDSVPQNSPLKHCPRCNRDLPATSEYFGKQSKPKDGFRYICRECRHNIYLADLARNPNFNKETAAKQRASLESKSPEEQKKIRAHRARVKQAYNEKRIKKDGYCNHCMAHPCEPGYSQCKKCRSRGAQRQKANHDKYVIQKRAYRDNLRKQVLDAYGNKCMCCGESRPEFLVVDHVNNDGKEHRRTIDGRELYSWLRKNRFPQDDFQLLCVNCNWGKHACGGVCPHQNGFVFPSESSERNHTQRWKDELRQEVLTAYGNKCACCSEECAPFLTIDHINGDGKEHRQAIGGGEQLYAWLRKHNFPKDSYQILCHNCNFAKYVHGGCPHQQSTSA